MKMKSARMTNGRSIQIYLFSLEWLSAVTMLIWAYRKTGTSPFGSSWATGTLGNTLAGIWIAKATFDAIRSFQSSRLDQYCQGFDLIHDDDDDAVLLFKAREDTKKKSFCDCQLHEENGKNVKKERHESATTLQSKIASETKIFLESAGMKNEEEISRISLPVIAVILTLALHCLARIFVIAHNFRRKIRSKGRNVRGQFTQLKDIPFTIGRGMSFCGKAFFIYSFINRLIRYDDDVSISKDGDSSASGDDRVEIRAISLDAISINSSQILLNSSLQKSEQLPSDNAASPNSQFSWLGLALGGFDMSFTIFINRKRSMSLELPESQNCGAKTEKQAGMRSPSGRDCSIEVRIRFERMEVRLFPRFANSIECHEMKVDGNVNFDVDEIISCCAPSNIPERKTCLSGFDLSLVLGRLDMYRCYFAERQNRHTSPIETPTDTHNKILTWDRIEILSNLRRFDGFSQFSRRKIIRTQTAALMVLPTGFFTMCDSKRKQSPPDSAQASPLRLATMSWGCFSKCSRSKGEVCKNRFSFYAHLNEARVVFESMELLLQNILSSQAAKIPLSNDASPRHPRQYEPVKKTEKKTYFKLVEMNAICCLHIHFLLPLSSANIKRNIHKCSHQLCDSSTKMVSFSLKSSRVLYQWRRRNRIKPLDDPSGSDHRTISPVGRHSRQGDYQQLIVNSLQLVQFADIWLQTECFCDEKLLDTYSNVLNIALLKGMKLKVIQFPMPSNKQGANTSFDEKSGIANGPFRGNVLRCYTFDLEAVVIRADEDAILRLTSIIGPMKEMQHTAKCLQLTMKQARQALANRMYHNSTPSAAANSTNKSKCVNNIDLSFNSVDMIIHLPGPPRKLNEENYESENNQDDGRVRLAFLQGRTTLHYSPNKQGIESNDDINQNHNVSLSHNHEGEAALIREVTEPESQKYDSFDLFEATTSQLEGSVTFFPHESLSIYKNDSSLPALYPIPSNLETSFYGQIASLSISTKVHQPKERSCFSSKVITATFDELAIYERYARKKKQGLSLFSFPLYDLTASCALSGSYAGLRMMQSDSLHTKSDLALILRFQGKINSVEDKDGLKGRRVRSILIESNSSANVEVIWSPILHWFRASCHRRFNNAFSHLKSSAFRTLSDKIRSLSPANVQYPLYTNNIHIKVDPSAVACIRTFLGVRSAVNTIIEGGLEIFVSTIKRVPDPSMVSNTKIKPSVTIQGKKAKIIVNGITSPIFTFDSFYVRNFIRRAKTSEITEYINKKAEYVNEHPKDEENFMHNLIDDLAADQDGNPTKEYVELRLGGSTTAKFPPTLHFGKVIKDALLTPKALSIGLNCLNGNQTTRAKKYQLMSIQFNIPCLEISVVDVDPDIRHLFGTSLSPSGKTSFREELRLCLESIDIRVERNTPPEVTQSHIRALDEDKSSQYKYGPSIQGGLVHLAMKHVLCILHPLNLATPLVRINDFTINGWLYMASLSQDIPNVQKGKIISSSLSCHHDLKWGSAPFTDILRRQCCCYYGISTRSTGVPAKLYTDCKAICGELDVSYGPVMNPSIPRLMNCIKRLLPTPPKSVESQSSSRPLAWWDNIRFFIHGPIGISINMLSIRWLLDSQTFRDQSIVLTCNHCHIDHVVGAVGVDAKNVNVSIPGSPYDMSCHPSKKEMTLKDVYLPCQVESVVGKGRHPLLHVPSLKTKISFSWKMFSPESSNSSYHHSPYLIFNDKCIDQVSAQCDKFALFRSESVSVEFDFELMGSDTCANWVALRIDVLPWFTHLNSTVSYPAPPDDKKPKPFPKLQSIALNASVKELKVATWFTGEESIDDWGFERLGGICLFVESVSYILSDVGNNEIVIGGPIKAALLDVTEFNETCGKVGTQNEIDEMNEIEAMASEFGARNDKADTSGIHEIFSTSPDPSFSDDEVTHFPFLKLQELCRDIDELDYVFISGQIDIQNQSLEKILCESNELHSESGGACAPVSQSLTGINKSTWSILVSRLKLLWTIEIRDTLMAIAHDLIFTVGFMKSQIRQSQSLAENSRNPQGANPLSARDTPVSSLDLAEEGVELSLRKSPKKSRNGSESSLAYLLQRDADIEAEITTATSTHEVDPSIHIGSSSHGDENSDAIPTLDVHFSNPQVQLHSKTTGGSVILAMEGARVEGRKFIRFLVSHTPSKNGKISPKDLIRKTEHEYTLTNLEAYALSTHVDVSAGLPWLEVCTPNEDPDNKSIFLEERFGIDDSTVSSSTLVDYSSADEALANEPDPIDFSSNSAKLNDKDSSEGCYQNEDNQAYNFIYPSHLRHHEPLAFSKTGVLRLILDKFTFQSRQIFHRPPIHYATEELIAFIKQGLVVTQEEETVDHIELQIDELSFMLDSYQFTTTIDLVRNLLLEPPKPHQRQLERENFEYVESKSTHKSSKRVSSVAATEMEQVIKSRNISIDQKHRGKKVRDALRTAAMNLLRDLEDRHLLNGGVVTRRIIYTLSKLRWCVQCPDEIDDVVIAFTGFHGQHDYSADGSVTSQFGLEDVHVYSSKPGPDSICFLDPTSVVKSVLGDERSPCQRCGKKFDHSKNDLNSCKYHTGKFESGRWTCCKSDVVNSPGCKCGPHTGKERAAVVRAEALPRTVDGISLYTHFEVNIFPGVPHTLMVQVSKSLSRLFTTYFFAGVDGKSELDLISTTSEITGSTDAFSVYSDNTPKQLSRKSLLIGAKGASPLGSRRRQEDLSDLKPNEIVNPSGPEILDKRTAVEANDETELIFIKVWRVGYVNVEVSLGGFRRLPHTSLDICVPAYSKAYKIGTWAYLVHKYLAYLSHEVLKSGASSSLDKFRRKVLGSNSSSPNNDILASPTISSNLSPRSLVRYTEIPGTGMTEHGDPAEGHSKRPPGAETILGSPSKKSKKKLAFGKK